MNLDNIFIGNTEPRLTNVLWIDTSDNNNLSVKAFINGSWNNVSTSQSLSPSINEIDYNLTHDYTVHLKKGKNLWSTFLDINLSDLEDALGDHANMIESHHDGFNLYDPTRRQWYGSLQSISNTKAYYITTNEECDITFSGTIINDIQPIQLQRATWIGYPIAYEMNINTALLGFDPIEGDSIEIKFELPNMKSEFHNGKWVGDILTLEPWQGYLYRTSTQRTVHYPSQNTVVKDVVFNNGQANVVKIAIDNEPIENSNNLITSGAVYAALHNIQLS